MGAKKVSKEVMKKRENKKEEQLGRKEGKNSVTKEKEDKKT